MEMILAWEYASLCYGNISSFSRWIFLTNYWNFGINLKWDELNLIFWIYFRLSSDCSRLLNNWSTSCMSNSVWFGESHSHIDILLGIYSAEPLLYMHNHNSACVMGGTHKPHLNFRLVTQLIWHDSNKQKNIGRRTALIFQPVKVLIFLFVWFVRTTCSTTSEYV